MKESKNRKSADFEEMFNAALREINREYESGTIPYIRQNHPPFWQKIVEGENLLGDLWLAGEVESFRIALGEWKNLNLQAIEIFRGQSK